MLMKFKKYKHKKCKQRPPSIKGKKAIRKKASEENSKKQQIFEVMLEWPNAREDVGEAEVTTTRRQQKGADMHDSHRETVLDAGAP